MSRNLVVVISAVIALLGFSVRSEAQCVSYTDSTPVDYLEYRDGRFTICYSAEYPGDLEIAKTWVSRAFELGREKYGVLIPTYRDLPLELTVYFPPFDTQLTRQGVVRMACCYGESEGSYKAEMHYLTPSAWVSINGTFGGLYRKPEDYHAHYIVHEATHFFQLACCGLDASRWITEGMAESDGYLHTTEFNRTVAVEKLTQRLIGKELGTVTCCEDLSGSPTIGVSSVYWAGGWIMMYLGQEFGEQIHVEMLREDLGTVLARHGSDFRSLFESMRNYIQSYRPPVYDGYTPSIACTGRYHYRRGEWSFSIRISNDAQRPPGYNTFDFQYRSTPIEPWITHDMSSIISRGYYIVANLTLPLFQGLSSPPFEWRARACPPDGLCTDWSDTIYWTVSSCANHSNYR